MFEYVKSRQTDVLTRRVVKERQLEKSKLRFRRIFQNANHEFVDDPDSISYSNIMTERNT